MVDECGLREALTTDHHFEQAGFVRLLGALNRPSLRTVAARARSSSLPATSRVSESFKGASGSGIGIISSRSMSCTAITEIRDFLGNSNARRFPADPGLGNGHLLDTERGAEPDVVEDAPAGDPHPQSRALGARGRSSW